MPSIRKLGQDEIEAQKGRKMSQRQRTAREYDAMVEAFEIGEWGEVTLDEDDNRLTVRSRLQSAAERRGIELAFQRTQGMILRFEVIELQPKPEHAPVAVETVPTTEKKKRGPRPRKATTLV